MLTTISKTFVRGVLATATFVAALFITLLLPGISILGDTFLEPGFFLTDAYWGWTHDPLQLLAALVLDVCFYTIVFIIVIWIRQEVNGSKEVTKLRLFD